MPLSMVSATPHRTRRRAGQRPSPTAPEMQCFNALAHRCGGEPVLLESAFALDRHVGGDAIGGRTCAEPRLRATVQPVDDLATGRRQGFDDPVHHIPVYEDHVRSCGNVTTQVVVCHHGVLRRSWRRFPTESTAGQATSCRSHASAQPARSTAARDIYGTRCEQAARSSMVLQQEASSRSRLD